MIVQTFDQIEFEFYTPFICPKKPIKVKVLIIPLFTLYIGPNNDNVELEILFKRHLVSGLHYFFNHQVSLLLRHLSNPTS